MSSLATVRRSGHGWVIPLPHGGHARCGGPAMCQACQQEAADLAERRIEVVWAVRLAPGMVTADNRTVKWVNGRQIGFADGTVEEDVTWLPIRTDTTSPPAAPENPSAKQALAVVRGEYRRFLRDSARAQQSWERTIKAMIAAKNADASMAQIGVQVGLSRERIRQIINEWASPTDPNGGNP
jgi:hypothetical protein